MKQDQKINLICRMAGNMMGNGFSNDSAINEAFEIFEEVEKRVREEVSLSDTMKGNENEKDD